MKIGPEIQDSITLKFSEIARQKNRKGEKVISLGIGEPLFDTHPSIVEATCEAMKNGYTKYSASGGLFELRQLIKQKLMKDNNIDLPEDNIVVTPGAKQALSIALMAILEPGDEVVNITPCYVSYVPQIKLAEPGAVIRNIDLRKEDHSIDLEKVNAAIGAGTKAIIINFPHNPTGKMLQKTDMDKLAGILESKKCYIVSDEVYEKLNFSGMPHCSIGSYKELADRTITINGFSKAFSMTGWRLGYLAAPKDVIGVVSKIHQHINTNTCTFVQKGACAAFALGEGIFAPYNAELARKAAFIKDSVGASGLLRLVSPDGGIFAFLDISKTGMRSDDLSSALLERKSVATIPGISFGDNWDDHIRVSLVAPQADFEEGIRRIVEFAKDI